MSTQLSAGGGAGRPGVHTLRTTVTLIETSRKIGAPRQCSHRWLPSTTSCIEPCREEPPPLPLVWNAQAVRQVLAFSMNSTWREVRVFPVCSGLQGTGGEVSWLRLCVCWGRGAAAALPPRVGGLLILWINQYLSSCSLTFEN